MVGSGARGMVGIALQLGPADKDFPEARDEFLRRYEARMTRDTRVFDEIPSLLVTWSATASPGASSPTRQPALPSRWFWRWACMQRPRGARVRRYHAACEAASGTAARGRESPRRRSGRMHLCGRRPARRSGGAGRGDGHRGCRLGLSGSWRRDRGLGRRPHHPCAARTLEPVADGLNYASGADLASTRVRSRNSARRAPVRS